jgi:hypothetical protein
MAFSGDVLHLAARPSTFLIRYGIIESLGVYIEYVRIVGTRCPMSLFGVWVQKTEIHGTNGMNNILKQAAPSWHWQKKSHTHTQWWQTENFLPREHTTNMMIVS